MPTKGGDHTSYKRLREALKQRGVPVAHIARLLGISRQAYTQREQRNTEWKVWEMVAVVGDLRLTQAEAEDIFYPKSGQDANLTVY